MEPNTSAHRSDRKESTMHRSSISLRTALALAVGALTACATADNYHFSQIYGTKYFRAPIRSEGVDHASFIDFTEDRSRAGCRRAHGLRDRRQLSLLADLWNQILPRTDQIGRSRPCIVHRFH